MKAIHKEVVSVKTVYQSVDGKEFTTEDACLEWEKSYKGTIEASWRQIKKSCVDSTQLGLPWSSEDYETYLLCPKNLDEIAVINAYIECVTHQTALLTAQRVGRPLVLNFGYDRDWCDVYEIPELVANILKYHDRIVEVLQHEA